MKVTTADTAETVVEAQPMNGSNASREAAESIVETLREHSEGGHELTVEVPKRKLLGFGNAQVLVRVRGPHGLDLDAATASADVVVTGRPRCADVRTASGDVSIEAADGATQVKTASGGVRISGQMRDATDVKTMSGDVIVRESGSATDVNTMSGDVRIRRAASGAIQMRSMSGDVEVAVAPGSTLFVDANSASGDVRSEIPVTGSAPSGPADVDLRATSMSGDIVVTRAPAAQAAVAPGVSPSSPLRPRLSRGRAAGSR